SKVNRTCSPCHLAGRPLFFYRRSACPSTLFPLFPVRAERLPAPPRFSGGTPEWTKGGSCPFQRPAVPAGAAAVGPTRQGNRPPKPPRATQRPGAGTQALTGPVRPVARARLALRPAPETVCTTKGGARATCHTGLGLARAPGSGPAGKLPPVRAAPPARTK